MSANPQTIKDQARRLIDELPDDATWADVLYEIEQRRAIEQGLQEAERGEFASDEVVQTTFAKLARISHRGAR
ncbi:MAG: hypothetical protein ACR2RB_09150 [Gammaproteobacteria bacterium]